MLKTCLPTYSFGEENLSDKRRMFKIIDKIAEFGVDAIEFEQSDWQGVYDVKLARRLREYAKDRKVKVANFCVTADFVNGSGGDLDKEVEGLCRLIDFACELGTPSIRHDITFGPAKGQKPFSYDSVLGRMAEGCARATEYAKSVGIRTMTENHGYFSQHAERVEKLLNAVGNSNFSSLLDVGNFMVVDEDPVKSVSLLAPYAGFVHVKDFHFMSAQDASYRCPGAGWFATSKGNWLRGAILGHGAAHARQSLGLIRAAGYNGYVSLEFEGIEDHEFGIKEGLKNLRAWIKELH